jgi:hypothetical protein
VAERASLVAVDRKLLVIQQQLADKLDLLNLIVRRRRQPLDRLRLDTVDLGLDVGDLLEDRGRERVRGRLRRRRVGARQGQDGDRPEHRTRHHHDRPTRPRHLDLRSGECPRTAQCRVLLDF